MALIVRGILWFGLYLFLILLPLATAANSDPSRVSPPMDENHAEGTVYLTL